MEHDPALMRPATWKDYVVAKVVIFALMALAICIWRDSGTMPKSVEEGVSAQVLVAPPQPNGFWIVRDKIYGFKPAHGIGREEGQQLADMLGTLSRTHDIKSLSITEGDVMVMDKRIITINGRAWMAGDGIPAEGKLVRVIDYAFVLVEPLRQAPTK